MFLSTFYALIEKSKYNEHKTKYNLSGMQLKYRKRNQLLLSRWKLIYLFICLNITKNVNLFSILIIQVMKIYYIKAKIFNKRKRLWYDRLSLSKSDTRIKIIPLLVIIFAILLHPKPTHD